jgi:hypothetical protein
MPLLFASFAALMLVSCGYSVLAGGRDGRIAVAMLLSAAMMTPLITGFTHDRWALAMVDTALFAGLIALAIRSNHYWPLWLAGLHGAAMATQIVSHLNPDLPRNVYHAVVAFWSIPMQVVIVVGILLDRRAVNHVEVLARTSPPTR